MALLLLLPAPIVALRFATPWLGRVPITTTPTRHLVHMTESTSSSCVPLLTACREACDVMSTLVRAVYESEEFGVERKSKDGSAFTLADGLVQVS